jgi:hypothetical protein
MPISTPSLASTSFSAHERESGIVSTKVAHEHSSHLQLLAQCQQEAAQRMAGRQKLKDEYANLLTQEEKRRDKLASDLVSTDLGDLFLSPACPSENDSEDTHVVSLEIAQSLFRQLAIDHLRKHYHTIKASYLIQFNSTAAQDRQEIISLISDQLIYSILPAIPDELRDFLSKEAIHDQNYRQKTGLAYFKVGQIYPTATGQITISSPEDFDRVYGDLLAVLSGIGLSRWEASQEKQQRVQTQLTQYKCTNPALPHPNFFNTTIRRPFRLFLLQEYMRKQLEVALTENPTSNNGINLLDYIKRLGEKPHSTEVLEAFYQDRLSSPSIYPENLKQVSYDRDSSSRISTEQISSNPQHNPSSHPPTSQPFSQSTFPSKPPSSGQAFLDKFRENMPKDLPLADLYKTVCLIHDLAKSEPDLAEIMVMKLETIVREYNPIHAAANLSRGSSQELLDLIAAIEHQIAQ